MRTNPGDSTGALNEHPLTPTSNFIPSSRAGFLSGNPNYFPGSRVGINGQTPDEMMKAYAAAMAQEKERANANNGIASSVFGTVRRFGASLWKK